MITFQFCLPDVTMFHPHLRPLFYILLLCSLASCKLQRGSADILSTSNIHHEDSLATAEMDTKLAYTTLNRFLQAPYPAWEGAYFWILDGEMHPVHGAEIKLLRGTEVLSIDKEAQQGIYPVVGLSSGIYQVKVKAPGLEPTTFYTQVGSPSNSRQRVALESIPLIVVEVNHSVPIEQVRRK